MGSSKSIPTSRANSECEETWCENPQNYPGTLIQSLLKNNTNIPRGLFDSSPSKKRSTDLRDIFNLLSEKEANVEEISNFIDDEPDDAIETTTYILKDLVDYV